MRGSGEISSYAIAQDGTLRLLRNTPVSSTRGCHRDGHRAERRRRTLYLNMARVTVLVNSRFTVGP